MSDRWVIDGGEGINPSPTIGKPNAVGLPYRASLQLGEDFDQLSYASC